METEAFEKQTTVANSHDAPHAGQIVGGAIWDPMTQSWIAPSESSGRAAGRADKQQKGHDRTVWVGWGRDQIPREATLRSTFEHIGAVEDVVIRQKPNKGGWALVRYFDAKDALLACDASLQEQAGLTLPDVSKTWKGITLYKARS